MGVDVPARHNRSARGAADRTAGVGGFEKNALIRKPVEVGRKARRLAVAPQCRKPVLVGKKK